MYDNIMLPTLRAAAETGLENLSVALFNSVNGGNQNSRVTDGFTCPPKYRDGHKKVSFTLK